VLIKVIVSSLFTLHQQHVLLHHHLSRSWLSAVAFSTSKRFFNWRPRNFVFGKCRKNCFAGDDAPSTSIHNAAVMV
jgi:hypothetical protein